MIPGARAKRFVVTASSDSAFEDRATIPTWYATSQPNERIVITTMVPTNCSSIGCAAPVVDRIAIYMLRDEIDYRVRMLSNG